MKASHDRPVRDHLFARESGVGRPRPLVEDERRITTDEQHDVGGGVRADARERQQALGELLVGQLLGRRAGEPLEIK